VICRDRSGAYAEGARTGAPDAVQVADRWHLWRNLADAVETVVVAHRGDLAEPTPPNVEEPAAAQQPSDPVQAPTPPETLLAARTRQRYAAVQDLLRRRGVSRAGNSRQLRLDAHTVRRFADTAGIDDLLVHTGRRDSIIDAFRPHLHRHWNEGCTDAAALCHEIRRLNRRPPTWTSRTATTLNCQARTAWTRNSRCR
jgi:Transposase